MKKNLRNILAVGLGLMTTVAFAQDWNVDSRTRIDMSGDNDYMSTDQRVTVGTAWGGSDWGIHVSSDVNYTLGNDDAASMSIYEAYAMADLMGFASLTVGRQALDLGSGALVSSRQWSADRTTWEGMTFGMDLGMADVMVGYHNQNSGDDATGSNMWINASGDFSGWDVNFLYMTKEGDDDAAMGIDISGSVMGAGIHASMNTDYEGDEMRVIGLTYDVNDDMGVSVSQTVYGEDGGFDMAGTNMSGADWSNGQMAYLNGGDEMISAGLTYNLSGISLGATMHQVTGSDDSERDVTEISLGYDLGNNAGVSLHMADDNDVNYMWVTLNVGL